MAETHTTQTQSRNDSNTGILVDLATENTKDCLEVVALSMPQPEKHETDSKVGRSASDVHLLCGYLAKVNHGGLIKGSKRRWFVFEKDTCALNWYRSPKDVHENPIGFISISDCVFTCTAEGLLENSFQITQGSRTHILQAPDQNTMLWWIQELQYERKVSNARRKRATTPIAAPNFKPGGTKWHLNDDASGGLLMQRKGDEHNNYDDDTEYFGDSLSLIPVLPRIENPPGTVGIESANLCIPKLGQSKTCDLGSKVTQMAVPGGITKLRSKPPRPAPPLPANARLADGPATQTKKTEHEHKSTFEKTTFAFSQIIDKLQNALKTGGKSLPAESKQMDSITEALGHLKEEINLMTTSLDSKDETIELLKKELSKYTTLNTADFAGNQSRDATTPSIHQMRSENTALKFTIEHLQQQVDDTSLLLKQEQDKTLLFQETLEVKDGIVVKLTNELHELSTPSKSKSQQNEDKDPDLLCSKELQDVCRILPSPKTIQDEVEAYRFQNKFLNNEILELTKLRRVDQEKIDYLLEKGLNQEALRCQLQSKYFILLSEMDKVRNEPMVDSDEPLLQRQVAPLTVVQQLIQEAIREGGAGEQEINTMFRPSKYDNYGFVQVVDDSDESTFLAAASHLQQTATNVFSSIKQPGLSVSAKWQKFMAEKDLQRNAEFKALVRLGIPHEFRHKVWTFIVHVRTYEIRQQLNLDGSYYQRLSEKPVAPLHAKQIDLDLLRTLPNNRFFSKIDSLGIQRLKRVLGAYSLHNPGIGYCQGLNRIAAISLLYLSEEDAFWCLVAIVECIMPQEYYSYTLTASQADQRVFRDLLAEKMPRVHAHLDTAGIDVSLITFNWFLCIFCDGVPPETMFNVWDVLLNESSKVLFRFCLAFFKHIEDDILELHDYMTLFNLLRKMVYRMYDVRALKRIAFEDMNPFPMRKIDRLRSLHIEKVRAELHRLDELRSEFANKRGLSSTNSDMCSDDEGEEE